MERTRCWVESISVMLLFVLLSTVFAISDRISAFIHYIVVTFTVYFNFIIFYFFLSQDKVIHSKGILGYRK